MNESDIEMIGAIALEISDRFKTIVTIFPDDKKYEHLLKNLAAASIHTALFMQDLVENQDGTKHYNKISQGEIDKFLQKCGCKNKQ
jgi:hypothetical protein